MSFSELEQNPPEVENQQPQAQEVQAMSEDDESGDRDLSMEEEARVEARLQRFIEEQTDAGNVPDRAILRTVRAILEFKVRQGDESRIGTPSSSPIVKTASTSPTASTSTSTSRMPAREVETTVAGEVVEDFTATPTSTTSSRQFFRAEGGNEASGKAIMFVLIKLFVPFNFVVDY
jgi:hypothetical protein